LRPNFFLRSPHKIGILIGTSLFSEIVILSEAKDLRFAGRNDPAEQTTTA
jgi:hypothetical protein